MKQVYPFIGSEIPMWVQLLFWMLYMVIFVYAFKKAVLPLHRGKRFKDVTWLFILFFALFAVFYCVNDDYFQYREWLNVTNFDLWGKEKFYVYTILFCQFLPFDYPYEVFRLIVWGGAVLMAYYTFRKYREMLMPGLTLLFLFVFYANTFCYARASLGMAVYFFGVSIFLLSKKSLIKLLGIAVALSSYLFHHEMIIGIAILPSVLVPFEKKGATFLSVILLILAIIVISYVNSHLGIFDAMFDNDDLSSKIEDFNNAEQGTFRLSTLVKYLNFFYPLYVITKCFWKTKEPQSIAGMYRIVYTIILITVAFMFVFGLRSVFVYRVMYISMIPLSLLNSYCYCNGYFKDRQFILMMMLALLSNSIRFINA